MGGNREEIVSEANLGLIIKMSPDASIMLSKSGIILFANPAAEQLFERPASAMIGTQFGFPVTGEKTTEIEVLSAGGGLKTAEMRLVDIEWKGEKALLLALRDISKRKRREADLRASEISYRRLFEAAKDGILIVDTETGMILDVNPFMVELLGFSKEEFLGRKLWDLGFFTNIVASKANFLELQAKGYVRYEDLPLQTVDGRQIDVEFVSNVYAVNSHTVIQCNIRDITKRKQAAEALQERIKELGCINTISRLANDPRMSIEEFVQQAVDILPSGWQHPEVCASRIMLGSTEFKTTNFRETAWRQTADILVERKKFGTITICYLEEKTSTNEGPFLKEERNLLDTLADFLGHIIQHRLSEEKTRASEERFRIIFDNSNDGLLLAEAETKKFSFANKAICSMLGYDQQEIKDIGVIDIHLEKDIPASLELFEKLSRKEIEAVTALPMKRKDGSVFFADVNATPVAISGKPYLLGVFRDITERQKLEDQLRQSQKMESIGTLASGIAHDFNNILSVILGFGNMVMDTLATDSPAKEDMLEVLTAAGRAVTLTQRLLLFSRKEVAEIKSLDINELLLDLRKMLERIIRESIELHLELADNPLIVQADAGMIEQVMMNLVSNARDAMPEGGRLSISTDLKEMDEQHVAVNGYGKPGRYALITVSDTGQGMNEATRKRIFEPFFTTKGVGRGTGLGLSISYGIVKQHDGYINVYSEPGQGTVFNIYLPLSEETSSPERTIAAVVPVKGGNETILVAEDAGSLRELNRKVLESFGYRVFTATDGEEAIARYMEHREDIDLLVLDMIMPKKNGKEVAAEIRKINPRIKVLFASGYTVDTITAKDLTAADCAFIRKPYQSKEFLIKVREVLDK